MDSPQEFSLAQLVEEPAIGLAMEDEGLDRRSLELMLEVKPRRPQRRQDLPDAPFVS